MRNLPSCGELRHPRCHPRARARGRGARPFGRALARRVLGTRRLWSALARRRGAPLRARGRAMQEAVPPGTGAMSAIMGVEPTRLRLSARRPPRARSSRRPTNAPGRPDRGLVTRAPSGRLAELVIAEKGRAIPLKVSAPFHCALMAPAARVVEAELARTSVPSRASPSSPTSTHGPTSTQPRTKSSSCGGWMGRSAGTRRSGSWRPGSHPRARDRPWRSARRARGSESRRDRVLSVGDAASVAQVSAFLAEGPG